MAALFTTVLFVGTAALALWVDVRAPELAPAGVTWRALTMAATILSFSFVPIDTSSYLSLYVSVFGLLLPLLTAMWLSAVWLLRSAADALVTRH